MHVIILSGFILFLNAARCIRGSSQLTIGPPSWQSDWLLLRSQAHQSSLLELYHGLNELPLKGKALVRPLSGANAGFSFEATGSAQWDDDDPVIYCGVVFVYNSTHTRLGAPTRNNAYSDGRIFCAGQDGWSDANGYAQSAQEADVKVLLWLEETLPAPTIAIDWTFVDCVDPNTVFFEFPNIIGKALAWVHIQVRVVDEDGLTWITEGIGSDNSVAPGYSKQVGGIVYSHNESSIRLWIRKNDAQNDLLNSIAVAADGWAFRAKPGAKMSPRSGEVRIFGWHSLGDPQFSETIEVDLDGDGKLPAEVVLNTKTWDHTSSLISLQITPLDGDNEGYVFYGTGVMPRAEYLNHPYGGVHFGYSQSLVRLFYPVGTYGCMMRIGPKCGDGMYQQCSRRARIQINIWGESQFRPESRVVNTYCNLAQYKVSTTETRSSGRCFAKCILQQECVAVKVEQTNGECYQLNAADAIKELETYDVNQYVIVYPDKCTIYT